MSDFGQFIIDKLKEDPTLWSDIEAIWASKPKQNLQLQIEAIARFALEAKLAEWKKGTPKPSAVQAGKTIEKRMKILPLVRGKENLKQLYVASGCKVLTHHSYRKLLAESWQSLLVIANDQ